jgi:hypothetical protein
MSITEELMSVELWLNDTNGEQTKYSEKILSQCEFYSTNPIRTHLGLNPGLRGENQANNRQSNDTTSAIFFSMIQ